MFMYFNPGLSWRRLTLVTFVFALVTGCEQPPVESADTRWPQSQPAQGRKTALPKPVEYVKELRFHSVVSGFDSVHKSFFEDGRIDLIDVVEGQLVSPGTRLARLYSPSLSEQLAAANAALDKNKAELKLSLEQLARGVQLFNKGVISKLALDEFKRTFDVQTQAVKEAQASVSRLKKDISNLSIVAAQRGIVASLYKRQGDFLSAGEPVLRFESTDRLKARFELPEQVALAIALGDTARIFFPSLNLTLDAVALEKSRPAQGELALHKVTFEIQQPQAGLVGLRCELVLNHGRTNAFEVDYNAIRYSIDGAPYVITVAEQLAHLPVDVLDLKASSVIVQAPWHQPRPLLIGGDINVQMDLHQLQEW